MQMVADAEAQKQMKEMFLKLAGDDLEVDAYELQSMLNSLFMKGTLQLLFLSINLTHVGV